MYIYNKYPLFNQHWKSYQDEEGPVSSAIVPWSVHAVVLLRWKGSCRRVNLPVCLWSYSPCDFQQSSSWSAACPRAVPKSIDIRWVIWYHVYNIFTVPWASITFVQNLQRILHRCLMMLVLLLSPPGRQRTACSPRTLRSKLECFFLNLQVNITHLEHDKGNIPIKLTGYMHKVNFQIRE